MDGWIKKEWTVQERKGYLKIHVVVDMRTAAPCFRSSDR
jgi:hypothetical protein